MKKIYTADSFKTTAGVDLAVEALLKGGYTGTAEDLRVMIASVMVGVTIVNGVTPTSAIPATGNIYTIVTTDGTYVNWNNLVVPVNSLAVLMRVDGVYSISKTAFDLSTYQKIVDGNKINFWSAQDYPIGTQRNHIGKDWYLPTSAALSTDVPGTSVKWVERLSGYLPNGSVLLGETKAPNGDSVYKSIIPLKKDLTPLPFYAINNSPTVLLAYDNEWSWQPFSAAISGYKLSKNTVTNQGYTTDFNLPYDGIQKELYFTMYFKPSSYISAAGTLLMFTLASSYKGGVQNPITVNKSYSIGYNTKAVGYETVDANGYMKVVSTKNIEGVDYNKVFYKFNLEGLGLLGSEGNLLFKIYSRGEINEHVFFDLYAGYELQFINKEYYISAFESTYVSSDNYNLANASMRGDFCSANINTPYLREADAGTVIVKAATAADYEQTNYGIVDSRIKGYGLETKIGKRLYIAASATETYTFGFWINKTKLNGKNIFITDVSGGIDTINYYNLSKGVTSNVYRVLVDFKVVDEIVSGGDTLIYIQFVTKLQATAYRYEFYSDATVPLQIMNFTSFKGNVEINPAIEYPVLYQKFNSNLVGKTLLCTGDSNGGGMYGTGNLFDRRFAVVGRLLGLKLVTASEGGWSMQSRMTNANAPYNWLYYHTHREKILAYKADIYYFNKCTNDSNQGAYAELVGGAKYGDGSWTDVNNAISKYDIVKSYLIANNTSATIDDNGTPITVANYCKKYFTTLGCTGALMLQLSKLYPKSLNVIDTTFQSTGYTNYLLGGFSAGGTLLSNILEVDANDYVVFPPYLLSSVVAGFPTTVIANGTKTGGIEVGVTPASTLSDGNNYNLYKFYAYSLYGKVVGTDSITTIENTAIITACHAYYNNNTTIYGRLTPELTKNLTYPLLEELKFYYNDRKDYLTATKGLTNWMNPIFIDPQGLTGLNYWNAVNIAADAGHYNLKGHLILGKAIASLLNQIGMIQNDNFLEISSAL